VAGIAAGSSALARRAAAAASPTPLVVTGLR
jgi:hypothetical protein